MDFADLSKYDDLCSDIFLDALYLWFKTTKMNTDHRQPRVPSQKVLEIIQRNILEVRKPNDAVLELLELDYFKHYFLSKSIKKRQDLMQHMKRYLAMYLPNAGFEISDTRRYKDHGRKVEACLVATKDWHVGDEIRACTGMIANLNPTEDAELRKGQRDFSVMWSQRKGCSCLFLGPARFVNHDCNSNCKFISSGQNAVTFKVVKEIKCGEELTAFYGSHYFGENNVECRCATCETNGEGYFAKKLDTTESSAPGDGRRRSSRKRRIISHDDYVTNETPRAKRTNTKKEPIVQKKRRNPTVMSIDFLCGKESDAELKAGSTLNLFYNVVVDGDYMNETTSKTMAAMMNNKNPNSVSSPLCSSSTSSISEDGSNESKGDSGVELSPSHWKDEESVNNDAFDGLVDDQSNLASLETTTLANIESADPRRPAKLKKSRNNNDNNDINSNKKAENGEDERLSCIACNRELRKEDISEQIGCDTTIAADLVTWTWTPSALFTDWHPKRCPRCERHFTIYCQEWPHRKMKKKEATKPIPEKTSAEKHSKSQPSSKRTSAISKNKKTPREGPRSSNSLDKATEVYLCGLFCHDDIHYPLSDFEGDEEELSSL